MERRELCQNPVQHKAVHFCLKLSSAFAEIACLQRDGSFAALKDFNDQCIENQAAEI